MWVLKVRGYDEGNIYGSKTKKHKVVMHYYPLNYYLEKNIYYFIAVGLIEGEEKNIKEFFKDLKRDNKKSKNKRYVVHLEIDGNFFICITAQHKTIEVNKYIHFFYNPKIIHINPAVYDKEGYETWNIACLNRKEIDKLLKIGEKKYKAEILSFKEAKIKNIGILSILPEITEKQKKAFYLAYENGYYEYPRRIELKELAKLMKISLSTYQAHLRKAEKSLLTFIARKYF